MSELQLDSASKLWTACSTTLRNQVSDAIWKTWLDHLRPVVLQENTLVIAAPSAVVKERVEARYLSMLTSAVSEAQGIPTEVRLELMASEPSLFDADHLLSTEEPVDSPTTTPPTLELPAHHGDTRVLKTPSVLADGDQTLDPRYTFEAFVIGSSNRFAHAAALAVAETPGRSYNPLFIHGGVGLGKTHLLHAIGNYVRQNYRTRYVRYVSTETLMNEFVDAIRTNTTAGFKRRYRECDVLLIDDIQFMEGRTGNFHEEFFHTFNALYGAAKQIVLTSDRPPKSFSTIEDRLRSRFLSGLLVDVHPPELETRLAILHRKAESEKIPIPDDVYEFIATNVTDNIRELEGALIRVTAYASLNSQPVDHELAEHILSDLVSNSQPRRITPQLILEQTALAFGFTIPELCGPSRRRPLVTARQISMYVFRELTDYSYPAIAREFGDRDHTTIIHAVEKISKLLGERRDIYDQVTDLIVRIKASA